LVYFGCNSLNTKVSVVFYLAVKKRRGLKGLKEGKESYEGDSKIILTTKKKVSWTIDTFLSCSCEIVFQFHKKTSVVKFSAVVEGHNHKNILRFYFSVLMFVLYPHRVRFLIDKNTS